MERDEIAHYESTNKDELLRWAYKRITPYAEQVHADAFQPHSLIRLKKWRESVEDLGLIKCFERKRCGKCFDCQFPRDVQPNG